MNGKPDLRRTLFSKLKKVSRGDRKRAVKKICSTLSCLPSVKSSGVIATFVAMKSEPDLAALLSAPPHSGGRFAVSRVTPEDRLEFRLLECQTQLQLGEHGFLEPDPEKCPVVDAADIDLVLTPGVAFDPNNFTRLGRGKGHYDRFLTKLRASRREPATVLGIAYQLQLVEVPAESHDQPMDGLVTETGYRETPLAAHATR